MRDILEIVFRNTILLVLFLYPLFAQTERFDYQKDHFSIELPASAKEIDAKTAGLLGSLMSPLVPRAPKFQTVHAFTSSDMSTQAVLVMLTDTHFTDAAFTEVEQTKAASDSYVQGGMSYDKEHHVLWVTATMASVLSGRIRAVSGLYLTRVGTILVQCYAKDFEFSHYEQECKQIVHSVVIDRNFVLLPPPPLSQLLAATTAEANDTYRDLTARVKAGDFSVDFRTLRMACAKSSICAARATPDDLSLMNKAQSERRFTEVVQIGQRLLNEGYINMESHIALMQAYDELRKPEQSQFHNKVMTALLLSILAAGDGGSAATAYEVISVRERYVVLAARHLPQSGESQDFNEGGHHYQKWTVKNPETHAGDVIFFNVDAGWQ